jgi:hypothetical protein
MYHITFPEQSNRASWVFVGKITDLENNPIDLTDCSMTFTVTRRNNQGGVLTASIDNGKMTFVDVGIFRWFFTKEEMGGLCADTYDTGMVVWRNDNPSDVRQLSVGPLPIVDGIVT